MLAVLEDLRSEHDFAIEVVDVDSRPEWQELYGKFIPVLSLADQEICHYFMELAKVREILERFR
jgi:hypothetical protein